MVLALAALATEAQGARQLGDLIFEHCTLSSAGLPQTVAAQCATLAVPEDRARPEGPQLTLAIAWVPSRAREPQPDPVFMLAGGPGQSARDSFAGIAGAFNTVLGRRHVILVDQRGTGGSSPLDCGAVEPEDGGLPEGPEAARASASACLAHLSVDPRHFTTRDAVEDLEDVRKALGASQLNLVGVSYGTRVALEYLRRYPLHTRALILDGVVPPGLALGSEHGRNLDSALALQFARCSEDSACVTEFPDPAAALARLRGQLLRQPMAVQFHDPLSNALSEASLDAAALAAVVRLYAYSPQLAALLPLALAELAAGRSENFMAQASMIESLLSEQITHGMQLSVLCSEDAARLKRSSGESDTLIGASFADFILAQCEVWPRGEVPADFYEPVNSDRPVLLFSGEFDPVTPPRYGEAVVRALPNGRHLVLRGQGHNVMTVGCAPRLMGQFLDSADAGRLDATCLERLIYTPPFVGFSGWQP